jgi:GT2 family glycosyltransferase
MNKEINPRVSIIIVHWDDFENTYACLKSVSELRYTPIDVIIVDNNSLDFSFDDAKKLLPTSKIIKSERNLGYAGGNNLGMKYAAENGADYIWILNNDVIVESESLSLLVNAAQSNTNVGLLGPKVMIKEIPEKILTVGGFIQEDGQIYHLGMGQHDKNQFSTVQDRDYLSGCALMASVELLDKIGFLDEDYFLYHEDIDLCYRTKLGGFKILFIPDAKVWHPDTRKRDENSTIVNYYLSRNSLLFLKKHKFGIYAIVRLMFRYIRRIGSWSLHPKWKYKKGIRNYLVLALFDFLIGNFGKSNSI